MRNQTVNITPSVIWEDDYILAINKPSGWIVNDSQTAKGQPTVQEWLGKREYAIAKSRDFRSGIVHRLDKETSGVLLVAKDENTFLALQSLFKERKVKKEYLALCHGEFKDKTGAVDAAVGRLPWNRRRFGVLPGGKEAYTEYEVEKEFEYETEKYSLVRFKPRTGRTHQIRIHSKYLGHPLVSDNFYAGRKTSKKDRLWCPRLFLHAATISFEHPVLHTQKLIRAPFPTDLSEALNKVSEG